MNSSERIARVVFGGDRHDVTRRAVSDLVPDAWLRELGLSRRTSHLGAALVLLGAGAVAGAAAYHVLGPHSRPVRARILAWIHSLRDEMKDDAAQDSAQRRPTRDGHAHPRHS